jgi:hypothetical protein
VFITGKPLNGGNGYGIGSLFKNPVNSFDKKLCFLNL